MCRRMPWIPTGPTRNHQRRRGATRLDQRTSTAPLPSTLARPACKTLWRRNERPDVSTSTTANRMASSSASMYPTLRRGCYTSPPRSRHGAELQQLRCQAGDRAALARRQGDVPEAPLTTERLDQHSQRVVGLAHVWRIDLAGVACENHLGAFADPRQHRLQRGRLEVLRFVDDDDLAMQGPPPQEGDGFERQLVTSDELVDQTGGVAAAALIGERDDRIEDRRHPRIELLLQGSGQEADLGAAHRHQWPVHGEALVPT